MKKQEIYNRMINGGFAGRCRITLEDVRTKHREIVETKNLVTNAIARIFETNIFGSMDFDNLQPMKKLFGGILLFTDQLTIDADNIFPQNQSINRMIANAGQTAYSGTGGSMTRGNPNDIATIIDAANSQIKFVWDWTLENGNGTISSAALTSAAGGDVGLYPDGTASLYGVYGSKPSFSTRGIGNTYDLAKSARYPVMIKSDGNGVSVFVSGDTLTEQVVRFPFVRPCLIESPGIFDASNYTIVSSRSATLSRSFTNSYIQIGQDASNYYVMERDSADNTKLYVDIVSKTDMSVTARVITISGATLARQQMTSSRQLNGIVSNGFIYWVSGADAKTFVKINISNTADVTILTSSLSANISQNDTPFCVSSGMILGRNYFINGDYVYPVAIRAQRSNENFLNNAFDVYAMYKNSPMLFQMPASNDDATYNYLSAGGCLFLPYLASCLNLQTPVVKSSNKTMRVEYTLTSTGG